jgi:chaperone required for assembly of F1-ATPase
VTAWTARRFWTTASAVPVKGGFSVQLDARPVRTPLKSPMVLPTQGLAEAVAAEWQAQGDTVDPKTMPFTRTANSAIDTVKAQFDAVAAGLADYGGSDLLCYRAEAPPELIARQEQGWDPLLAWAAESLQAPLHPTKGIVHVVQPPGSLSVLRALVFDQTAFQLAAFHDLVALSGSLILALAVQRRRLSADEAWQLSRIDEDWQIELWGEDEEAADFTQHKRAAFRHADRFYELCG